MTTRSNFRFQGEVVHLAVVLALSLLTVAARLFYLEFRTDGDWSRMLFSDEMAAYFPAAQELRRLGLSYFLTPRSLWSGPVNPMWIALWESIPVARVMNVILMAICGVGVWLVTRRLFSTAAAYAALLAMALHVPLYVFSPTILTEPVFTMILFFGLALFIWNEQGKRSIDLLAGLITGIATLVRPTAQLFPLFLLALFIAGCLFPWRRVRLAVRELSWKRLVIYGAGFLLLVVPYIAKNALYLDKAAIANGSGAVLYLGNDLRKNGDEPVYSEMTFDTFEITAPYTHLDTEGDRRLGEAGKQFIKNHPFDVFLLTLPKPFKFLFGYPQLYFFPYTNILQYYPGKPGWRVAAVTFEIFFSAFVTIGGILGILLLPLNPMVRFFAGGLVLYFIALHSLTCAYPRLAVPMFPVLAVFAGGLLFASKRVALLSGLLAVAAAAVVCFIGLTWTPGVVSERSFAWYKPLREVAIDSATNLRHVERVELEDGTHGFKVVGHDPAIRLVFEPFEAGRNQVILIEMIAWPAEGQETKTVPAQLFWSTKPDRQGFREKRSRQYPVIMDGKTHFYRISPSRTPTWKGKLSAFRFDFPDSEIGARYKVKRLLVAR